jgi:uncharacterized membrane protein
MEDKKTIKLGFTFGQKQIGALILLLSIVVGFFFYSLYNQLIETGSMGCGCGADSCPALANPPLSVYLGFTLITLIGITGIYFIISPEPEGSMSKHEWEKILKTLKEDERKIYQTILENEGVMFQSDLVAKTKINKVKISRTLDILEGRGLLERRRRGMANVVILKKR